VKQLSALRLQEWLRKLKHHRRPKGFSSRSDGGTSGSGME
jgi:hypothetical protein